MASHNDQDGLHVQAMEGVHSPTRPTHISEVYKPQPTFDTKEPLSTLSSPQYYASPPPTQYFDPHTPQHPPPAFASDTKPCRNPWNLSPWAFAAIIVLVTAIIVGGAVGGAVAAGKDCLASSSTCTASPSSASSTGSSTTSASTTAPTGTFRNYIPPTPSNVESLYNDCGSLNGSMLQSKQGSFFRLTCPQAILGSSGVGGVTLSELVAYTLEDCVNACSLMNFWRGSTVCNSVTWDNGMAGATTANFGGNCWLFNSSAVFQVKANSTSARLQS